MVKLANEGAVGVDAELAADVDVEDWLLVADGLAHGEAGAAVPVGAAAAAAAAEAEPFLGDLPPEKADLAADAAATAAAAREDLLLLG